MEDTNNNRNAETKGPSPHLSRGQLKLCVGGVMQAASRHNSIILGSHSYVSNAICTRSTSIKTKTLSRTACCSGLTSFGNGIAQDCVVRLGCDNSSRCALTLQSAPQSKCLLSPKSPASPPVSFTALSLRHVGPCTSATRTGMSLCSIRS